VSREGEQPANVIALDAMGGDFGPPVTVEAAVMAAAEGIEIVLVGDERALRAHLDRWGEGAASLRVVHADAAVAMDARGTDGLRAHAETSLRVAAELVKRGDAQAMVSMGNTGAAMTAALTVLGRLRAAERPALAVVLPGGPAGVLLLDAGANADPRVTLLVQHARLGSAYMRTVRGITAPRVALLSIGEESSKGSSVVLQAHAELASDPNLHFVGNLESRDLLSGRADVVVTDGFTGNVVIKLLEGLTALLLGQVRTVAAESLDKQGTATLLPALAPIASQFQAEHYGAAPLLGVNGGVFIGHGRSDAETVATAIRTAYEASERSMLKALAASLGEGT
jgi:glycerol-3-phosphate acyltransferase PlsX